MVEEEDDDDVGKYHSGLDEMEFTCCFWKQPAMLYPLGGGISVEDTTSGNEGSIGGGG